MYNFSCALNESYAAQVTVVGGGAKLWDHYTKQGQMLRKMFDLQIRLVLSTGSPLKPECFEFINTNLQLSVRAF